MVTMTPVSIVICTNLGGHFGHHLLSLIIAYLGPVEQQVGVIVTDSIPLRNNVNVRGMV